MAKAFKLPDLGEGIHEAEVVAILVSVGDHVEEGQPFMEVETDKARVEIPSPYTGIVEEINVRVDDTVSVGSIMMVFGDGDGAQVARPGQTQEGQVSREAAVMSPPEGSPEPLPGAAAGQAPAVSPAGSVSPPAPVGIVLSAGDRPVPASPATRRLARELGVDLRQVPGNGPAGLVTADDVRAFARRGPAAGEAAAETLPGAPEASTEITVPPREAVAAPPLPDFSRWGQIDREPLRSVRKATARHMALAWAQIPHVNHQEVVDITELEDYRRKHAEELEALGGKLTLTVFVIKAVVAALKSFPRLNASIDPEAEEIILKRYYHMGVAVDTERGLLVPVLRDVDRKSITELSVDLAQMAQRARAGETSLEEMQGGSFTITNIGALGGTAFSPIINYPQVAILGMGRARLQPVVRGTEESYEIVPRLMMPLILAFDHRLIDGAEAARFVGMIVEALENPARLWLRI